MRMLCRRHYSILLALVVFLFLQVFLKLNNRLSTSRGILPEFPLNQAVQDGAKSEETLNKKPIDEIIKKPEDFNHIEDFLLDGVPEPQELIPELRDGKEKADANKAKEPQRENGAEKSKEAGPQRDGKGDKEQEKDAEEKDDDADKEKEGEQDVEPKDNDKKKDQDNGPRHDNDPDKPESAQKDKDAKNQKDGKHDEIQKLKEAAERQKEPANEEKKPDDKSEVLLQPDESEAKKMIAQDVLNDENEDAEPAAKAPEDKDQELFVFPDEDRDADLYTLDYSYSHPFDNQCHYPVLKRDEPDLRKYVRHYRRIDCPAPKGDFMPMVSQLPSGEIMVGVPHRAKFRSTIKCVGRELSGTLRKDGRKVTEIGEWFEIPQDKRIFVNKDQFIVKCTDKSGKTIFNDIFTSLAEKPRLKPESVEQPDKYNVDMFVIDSTARNQFFRHMPLTLQFMRRLDFKFLHGHTKVGDNSAVNLLPLLSGKIYDVEKRGFKGLARDDMVLTSEMLKEDFWKYSDMLIQIARDQGCPTLWNDDIASVGFGLFNYYTFPGFIQPPADFYYRPYYHYLYQKLNAGSSCINGEMLIPRYIQIWERFARRYAKECHFAFNFMTGLTHASASNVELYDQDLAASLNRMEQDGVFDHSFVLIMGDHGQRISAIQKSYTGRIEERMPLVSIHIPQKFRQQHPDKVRQLEINQNRLTSNFDVYEMLREVMGLDTNREPVGRSLFKEIPRDRNCSDARIPVNFCMCQRQLSEDVLKPNDRTDINDAFMNEIGGYFASDCIKSHRVIAPKTFTPFTISNQARMGIRYPKEWQQYLEKHTEPNAEDNEMFDVELDPAVDIKMTKNERSVTLMLKARVLWDRGNQQGRLTAPPLITNGPCGGIRSLDEICKCNAET